MPAPDPPLEPGELGRFEPTPYDLGITDDPAAGLEPEDEPEAEP